MVDFEGLGLVLESNCILFVLGLPAVDAFTSNPNRFHLRLYSVIYTLGVLITLGFHLYRSFEGRFVEIMRWCETSFIGGAFFSVTGSEAGLLHVLL